MVESESEKPLIHSLILGGGKRLDIRLEFDRAKWTLQNDASFVCDLDEFALTFDRIDPNEGGSNVTLISMRIDEIRVEIPYDGCGDGAVRFRVGPLLAVILNERKIVYQSRAEEEIDMDVHERHSIAIIRVRELLAEREKGSVVGTRVLSVDDGGAEILPEVYALHSPFFLSLFFGDFSEARQEVISIGGVECDFLHWFSSYLANCKRKPSENYGLEQISNIYRLADRFLVPIPDYIDAQLRKAIEKRETSRKEGAIVVEISKIQHRLGFKPNIMIPFLDRFAFVQCLSLFLEHHFSTISPEIASLIYKRTAALLTVTHQRPKLAFANAAGEEVVVEVPTDVTPELKSVVDTVRGNPQKYRAFGNTISLDVSPSSDPFTVYASHCQIFFMRNITTPWFDRRIFGLSVSGDFLPRQFRKLVV